MPSKVVGPGVWARNGVASVKSRGALRHERAPFNVKRVLPQGRRAENISSSLSIPSLAPSSALPAPFARRPKLTSAASQLQQRRCSRFSNNQGVPSLPSSVFATTPPTPTQQMVLGPFSSTVPSPSSA